MSNRVKVLSIVLAALAAVALGACGSSAKKKQRFAYVERPVEQIYQDAARAMERKRYDDAVELFGEVERQHPYSPWARRATLMKAFAHYRQNDYDESIEALDQFISLHPGNKDAPYAYYLKAMCNYEQIRDVGRDQDFTNNAVQALNDVIRRFPQTEYARDARLKLDLTLDHLAGKELDIGRYYQRQGKHIAAINRYRTVINNYQTTGHTEEALYRLTEANLQIGLVEEARQAAAVLGHNYPGSVWYEDAYRLIRRNGLLEPGSKPTRSAREVRELEKREKKNADKGVKEAPRPVVEPPSDDPFGDSLDNPLSTPGQQPQ
ncbi:MAG TPA: outer membrane protein assembly factor BamD [Parvularcula sp.]|nr:outer membrane protein assembly factor BamD [Parvularcula sp.]HBS35564.1 outer membrane protein assembly factor BamD [Parvularcula sp.]